MNKQLIFYIFFINNMASIFRKWLFDQVGSSGIVIERSLIVARIKQD